MKDVSSGHMSGLNDTATLVTGLRICLGTRRKTSRGYKLSPMCSYRPIKVSAGRAFLCLSLVCVACDRDTKPDTKDFATTPLPEATVKQFLSRNTGWDESSAGPFMLLSVPDDPVNAALVLPQETDSTLSNTSTFQLDAFSNVSVDLFGTSRTAGKSSVAVNAQQLPAEGCVVWPSVRLTVKPALSWKVGFLTGRATAVRIDSVENLGSNDSSRVASELARQASALTLNGDPEFQGLPFIVQKAYRLSMGDTTVLIGSVVRKINEEANPREEHLLLVMERAGAPNGGYTVAFQSRSAGSEDVVRTSAVLAAVRFVRTNRAAIVVSFEYDDGGQVALLERVANHDWKITWRSAYTGC